MNQLEKMLTNMESDLKNHEETRQLLRTLSEDPDRIKDGEKMRELAVRARFNYNKAIESGFYSNAYLQQLKDNYKSDIRKLFNAMADRDIAFWESKLKEFEKKNAPKEKPKEVQEQLLEMKNLEYSLKAADKEELQKMADNIIKGELKINNQNELNVYLSFFNQAGLNDYVSTIKKLVTEKNLIEPWKNDNIYQALKKAMYESKVYKVNEMLFLEEGGRKEAVFLDDLLKF